MSIFHVKNSDGIMISVDAETVDLVADAPEKGVVVLDIAGQGVKVFGSVEKMAERIGKIRGRPCSTAKVVEKPPKN